VTEAIILFGPPASGKDTVTKELEALDSKYRYFHRLKVGGGRDTGYRSTTESALHRMQEADQIIYSNQRYESTYAVDRLHLDELLAFGRVPIVHIGQIAGVETVVRRYPARWLVVGLWCSRIEAERRLQARSDSRTQERITAWDTTLAEQRSADPDLFGLQINTGEISPDRTAQAIHICALEAD
jgi:guanylate kinase